MDFGYMNQNIDLRDKVKKFIKENLTQAVKDELEASERTENISHVEIEGSEGKALREFLDKIRDNGWQGISWPKKYGGQDGSRLDQYIVEEEFGRIGISAGGAGGTAAAIMAAGTEEQKNYFIPGIINGDINFCQGFTEPSGGADLASLQCRAVLDGDDFIVNGQKIYTSGAHAATHVYLMVRTDPEAPKHRGISILLVPMDTPGITIRPLYSIQNDPSAPMGTTYGHKKTNETFYENVRVSKSALLGEINMGWYVGAMGLNLDRVGASRYLLSVRRDEDIINWMKNKKLGEYDIRENEAIRDKTAEMWIEAQVCRLMTMRSMSIVEHGGNFSYEGSAEKVWAPEHGVRATESYVQMLGPYGQLLNTSANTISSGIFAHNLLGAFQSGINHGSVQIMRDQVGRRGLGLPRG